MGGSPGSDRREQLRRRLQQAREPITGAELAQSLGASRQIVVQDVALLRACGEPILATARGYMLLGAPTEAVRAIMAMRHSREETGEELGILVDYGGRVLDVVVDHPLYGEQRAPLMVASRADVEAFLARLAETGASLLSDLTGGVHLHTVEFPTAERLEQARAALLKHGFLLQDDGPCER